MGLTSMRERSEILFNFALDTIPSNSDLGFSKYLSIEYKIRDIENTINKCLSC